MKLIHSWWKLKDPILFLSLKDQSGSKGTFSWSNPSLILKEKPQPSSPGTTQTILGGRPPRRGGGGGCRSWRESRGTAQVETVLLWTIRAGTVLPHSVKKIRDTLCRLQISLQNTTFISFYNYNIYQYHIIIYNEGLLYSFYSFISVFFFLKHDTPNYKVRELRLKRNGVKVFLSFFKVVVFVWGVWWYLVLGSINYLRT